MELIVNNFAKIKSADIVIDGITVIAGENNTGKSTIGKILYATFNSLYNLEKKIEDQRKKEIRDVFQGFAREFCFGSQKVREKGISPARISRMMGPDLFLEFLKYSEEEVTFESMEQIFREVFKKYGIQYDAETEDEYVAEVLAKILIRQKGNEYEASLELISRFFDQIFNSQVQCLRGDNDRAIVHLVIKNRNLILQFQGNECVSKESNFDIMHEAFFIDDPFIIDNLSFGVDFSPLNNIRGKMMLRLQGENGDPLDGIFDAVYAKENLKDIYNILNQVTDGNIMAQNGEWALQSDRFNEPILFDNLSAGLKSFVIIKMLLEEGILKEKDVLILDEPEIHLHPDWQLKYAQIVVLLQKMFDLSIVVTTHSQDFLEAIELYSKKYNLETRCNYYLSSVEEGLVTFEHVEGSLNKIFGQMVSASMLLDDLRYSLEDSDE